MALSTVFLSPNNTYIEIVPGSELVHFLAPHSKERLLEVRSKFFFKVDLVAY